MDNADSELEISIESIYYCLRGSDAYILTDEMFTKNSLQGRLRDSFIMSGAEYRC